MDDSGAKHFAFGSVRADVELDHRHEVVRLHRQPIRSLNAVSGSDPVSCHIAKSGRDTIPS